MIRYKLLLSIVVAIMLASCSKDDGPVTPPVEQAKLSVGLQLRSQAGSKATGDDPNALPGESDIHNLSAFVFNSDGSA